MVADTIGSYIPQDRRYALAQRAELSSHSYGAALFADICGFTPLTEALAHQLGAQRGAEELTHQLSRIYGALIGVVDRYGGSVIGFSGDAITCWFDSDEGLRATACALEMQATSASFATITTPKGTDFTIAIKIAVAAGPARRFVVGDPQIQRIDVLAGHTLDVVVAAEHLAAPGEVVLAAATAARLDDRIVVAGARADQHTGASASVVTGLTVAVGATPWPALADEALTTEQPQSWLLPAVAARLRAGAPPFLADLRPATALFLGFSGIDYDADESAGSLLDAYIRRIQATTARYEGSLLQLTIGDKGCYLYAAFGALMAHDDDPARAVACALDLHSCSKEFSYIREVRIGLTQGQMYAGAYGGPTRRTYGVLGDKTNLAARLMDMSAPGAIVCDDAVAALAGRRWAFETLPPVQVKGKAGLIRVYRPTGAPAGSGQLVSAGNQPHTIVGRQAEVARLEAALDALQIGASRIMLIEGEAGIGKSRLVAELGRLLRARGLIGLIGAGQSIEQQTPYRAWRDIFSSFFELDSIADPCERRMRVQQVVQETASDLIQRLPLLNDLLNLGFPDTPLTATLDPKQRQESLAGMLIALLHAWARGRPLVLVLEDTHWLDSLSWMLTTQIARTLVDGKEHGRQIGPMLLVLASRPLDEPGRVAHPVDTLRAMDASETLTLGALGAEELIAIVTARLGLPADALPEAVAELVRERAGGNPFFAEELVIMLRDHDLIAIEATGDQPAGARCIVASDLSQVSLMLPDTLQGMILARIDRLPPEQQFTLKVAAVIGRSFSEPPLRATLTYYATLTELDVRAHLDELARRELTLLETVEPELTYYFKHIITQEVAYQTLLFAQRTQIHRTVAEWYERTFGGAEGQALSSESDQPGVERAAYRGRHSRLAPYYSLLVHHYRQAEDVEREQLYARLAGQRAAAQFANAEAVTYLSRALALTHPSEAAERYELLRAREQVYDLQGNRVGQAQDLATMAAIAAQIGDNRQRIEVLLRQAHFGQATGDFGAAIISARHTVDLAQASGDVANETRAYLEWGWALMRQATDYAAARTKLTRAMELARAAQLMSVETTSLRLLGLIAYDYGDSHAARDYTEQARLIAEATGDRQSECKAIGNLGFIERARGAYAQSLSYDRLGIRMAREIGDRRTESMMLVSLGMDHVALGDYVGAEAAFEQALRIAHESGDRQIEAWTLTGIALSRYQQDNYDAARDVSARATEIYREVGSQSELTRSLAILGHGLLALGELAQAADVYEQCLALLRSLGTSFRETEPLAGLAHVALARGDLAQALAYAESILVHMRQGDLDGPYDPFYVPLSCYQVLQAAGDPRAASTLAATHTRLLERADNLGDEALRRSFLENVPANRAIEAAWAAQLQCAHPVAEE